MAWNYDHRVGPKGGTLIPLANYCESVRVLSDGSGTGKEGENADVMYLHGQRADPEKYTASGLVTVECTFRWTNSAGAITHTDGAAGHVYENQAIVKDLFYSFNTLTTLQRIAPHQGTVQVNGEMMAGESVGDLEWRLLFSMLVEDPPFWQSTTLSGPTSVGGGITIGGNAPVDDFEVNFSGGTNAILTHTQSGKNIAVIGATPGGGLQVYPRRGIALSGGTDFSNQLSGSPGFFDLKPGGSNTFSLAGGGSATISWRNKWRL